MLPWGDSDCATKLDGKTRKVPTQKRREKLIKFIETYEPEQNVEVCYMYYDYETTENMLSIQLDADFYASFEPWVTYCEYGEE